METNASLARPGNYSIPRCISTILKNEMERLRKWDRTRVTKLPETCNSELCIRKEKKSSNTTVVDEVKLQKNENLISRVKRSIEENSNCRESKKRKPDEVNYHSELQRYFESQYNPKQQRRLSCSTRLNMLHSIIAVKFVKSCVFQSRKELLECKMIPSTSTEIFTQLIGNCKALKSAGKTIDTRLKRGLILVFSLNDEAANRASGSLEELAEEISMSVYHITSDNSIVQQKKNKRKLIKELIEFAMEAVQVSRALFVIKERGWVLKTITCITEEDIEEDNKKWLWRMSGTLRNTLASKLASILVKQESCKSDVKAVTAPGKRVKRQRKTAAARKSHIPIKNFTRKDVKCISEFLANTKTITVTTETAAGKDLEKTSQLETGCQNLSKPLNDPSPHHNKENLDLAVQDSVQIKISSPQQASLNDGSNLLKTLFGSGRLGSASNSSTAHLLQNQSSSEVTLIPPITRTSLPIVVLDIDKSVQPKTSRSVKQSRAVRKSAATQTAPPLIVIDFEETNAEDIVVQPVTVNEINKAKTTSEASTKTAVVNSAAHKPETPGSVNNPILLDDQEKSLIVAPNVCSVKLPRFTEKKSSACPSAPDVIIAEVIPAKCAQKNVSGGQPVRTEDELSIIGVARPLDRTGLRPIAVDGSNVAYRHGRNRFSCRGVQLCLDYFLKRGHTVIKIFVPLFRSTRVGDTVDRYILDKIGFNHIVYTPSRVVDGRLINCYDDRFLLEYALNTGAVVVSNDNFRDLMIENKWNDIIKYRLLMYTFVDDLFMVPDDPLGKGGPKLDDYLRF